MFGAIDSHLAGSLRRLDQKIIEVERRRALTHAWAISGTRFTTADNRSWWNDHDWSRLGEEWTLDNEWKAAIIGRYIEPYVPVAGTVLEVGPGAGRWTGVLLSRASRVYVVDVAERPLGICSSRFAGSSRIACIRTDGRTIPLASNSLDAIWSYDVFVHLNPVDTASYFTEFERVLRRGAFAVIHHPGRSLTAQRTEHHRSDLTDEMVTHLAEARGLAVVLQTNKLVHPGDCLTILQKR